MMMAMIPIYSLLLHTHRSHYGETHSDYSTAAHSLFCSQTIKTIYKLLLQYTHIMAVIIYT